MDKNIIDIIKIDQFLKNIDIHIKYVYKYLDIYKFILVTHNSIQFMIYIPEKYHVDIDKLYDKKTINIFKIKNLKTIEFEQIFEQLEQFDNMTSYINEKFIYIFGNNIKECYEYQDELYIDNSLNNEIDTVSSSINKFLDDNYNVKLLKFDQSNSDLIKLYLINYISKLLNDNLDIYITKLIRFNINDLIRLIDHLDNKSNPEEIKNILNTHICDIYIRNVSNILPVIDFSKLLKSNDIIIDINEINNDIKSNKSQNITDLNKIFLRSEKMFKIILETLKPNENLDENIDKIKKLKELKNEYNKSIKLSDQEKEKYIIKVNKRIELLQNNNSKNNIHYNSYCYTLIKQLYNDSKLFTSEIYIPNDTPIKNNSDNDDSN